MSTRKSMGTVGAKVENVDVSKDKDNDPTSNIIEEGIKTTTITSESIGSVKVETDTAARASTPTQKETTKALCGANSNSRVTRNSPLLTTPSPCLKKEPLNAESEPTNSEGEESGQTKKQIRGRKSIKEAKESTTKEQTKETLNRSTEELMESIEIIQISNKDNEKDQKDNDNDNEKDANNLKDNKEKNSKDIKSDEETEVKDCVANQNKDSKFEEKDTKSSDESNDKDLKDTKENKDIKENKDTKDSKETKDKDLKEAKDPKEVAAIINRLTRNAAAQEVASKSRITRNRQSSAGNATRPETPPTARRGRPCNAARKPIETTVAQKRKRSVEESTDSPLSKVIKTEPKDISDATEEINSGTQIPTSGNTDLEGVRIKQELIESDDGGSTMTESTNSGAATIIATTTGRGRGNRWTGRKPAQTVSPSTRSTRQNKVASPLTSNSPVPERKRRRTAGTPKRGSSLSKSTTTHATGTTGATPDEDSKDSMASSMDDILLTDIKMEKLTPEFEENLNIEIEAKKSTEEEIDESMEPPPTPITPVTESDVAAPLTVETETQVAATVKQDDITTAPIDEASTSEIASNDLNKDASLSPELISEGVSEISVKQFYNRPKFLENNLGIEEDPKLREIVQKVTTELDNDCSSKEISDADAVKDTTNDESATLAGFVEPDIVGELCMESNNPHEDSFSAESLKEGDLMYEESSDGKKTPVNEVKVNLPTTNSLPLTTEIAHFVQEKAAIDDTTEAVTETSSTETNDKDEVLEERLVMAEEDLDDDDLTVEESETISMDNNPSLHDDAPEEEQDVEEESIVDELPDDVITTVPDNVLIDEITDEETKQTSNECDIEKAKLQEAKEDVTQENDDLNIENESLECNVKANESDVVHKVEETNQKEQEPGVKKELNSNQTDDKQNVQTLKTSEIKIEERKNKSIIVTKFDSDEKEPPVNLNEVTKVDEKAIKTDKKASEIETLCGERRLSTTKVVEQMEVNDTKAEQMETDEVVKDEPQSHLNDSSVVEKMDISQPVSPKYEKSNSNSSNSNSPIESSNRIQRDSKDDDAYSIKSTQSTDANSWTTIEPDCEDEEKIRQKEQHFKNLGLLTHKAAEQRRQDIIQTAASFEATRVAAAAVSHHHSKRNGSKLGATNSSSSVPTAHEYTGTLKTVIKLNRNSSGTATGSTTTMTVTTASTTNGSSGRKPHITNSKDNNSGVRRQSLKMTFQKGRGRGHTAHTDRTGSGHGGLNSGDLNEHGEDAYYTIQNENEGAQKKSSGSSLSTATAGTKDQQIQKQHLIINNSSNVQTHGRKPYNSRSNTSNSYHHYQNHHFATNSTHIESSHSEGHYDGTTHHSTAQTSIGISSHKKDDREEILIPEKASSFKFHPGRLCEDQCYYCSGKFGLYDTPCHVGQIKSVERQQKILKNEEKLTVDNCLCDACFRHVDRRANVPSYKKRLSASGHLENVNASAEANTEDGIISTNAEEADGSRKCVVPECGQSAAHSLRRKCIRKSVKKFLLNFDMPTGTPYIWLCQSHYDAVIQCSGCVLCKRRLGKNHMYHITSDTERLEKALTDMGIPVQLGIGTAVCKLCRYFANLLMKPPDSTKSQKAEFVKNYRKRLLQFHNIHDGSNDVSEADEDEHNTSNPKSNDLTVSTSTKASKTTQSRRMNKDQANANSSTASSSSSVICMAENAIDNSDEIVPMPNKCDKSQKKSTLLGNEILIDYNMSAQNSSGETSNENSKSPIPSPNAESDKQSSRLKAILQSEGKNKSSTKSDLPSALLRANPNLSMRELFPGEEDLGLHFKAPFGSSNSQRTPEGWTRVQTFLQYDEPTRRLWEELQKPYGNQSSFLRHLILLEKYYRNGDLVLSANASSNASVYTKTVRQRLNSYDQGHCGGLDTSATTSSKSPLSATKENTKSTDIPLVEINDDDDEEEAVRGDPPKNFNDKFDDNDVIMKETPKSVEANSTKHRTRSVSVDKLTRQLSTNAVTITARPKDAAQVASASVGKSVTVDPVQKRTDLPKLQHASSVNTQNSIASVSLAPLNTTTTAGSVTTGVPASIASSSSNSRSILKSNLLGITNNKSVEILPIALPKSGSNANLVSATTVNIPAISKEGGNSSSGGSGSSTTSSSSSKQQKILEVANKLLDSQMEAAAVAAKQQASSLLASPPELVSLQRRSAPNAVSSGSGTGTSSTMSSTTASLINAKRPHLMANRPTPHNRSSGLPPPNVVILPNTLSTHERAESKSWRPTLMSVEENQHLLNKNGPLYQTADGRRLPGLVQVQSGGKPFLISIFDYNRMCILRREKLMRDGMLNSGKHKSQQQQNRHMQQSSNYNKMNSGSNSGSNNNNNSSSGSSKHAQSNAAQQQFMQLLHFQKQQQAAAMKAANNSNNNRYHPIAPKQTNLTGNSATANLMQSGNSNNSSGNNMNMNNASNSSRLATNQPNFPMPLLANALSNANAVNAAAAAAAATLNNNPWLWSNFPDSHELLRNGAHGGLSKLPPLLPKPTTAPNTSVANNLAPPATITSKQLQQHQQQQQQHQMLLDNTLMSKIPKSLTVIPQHKLMGSGSSTANKE